MNKRPYYKIELCKILHPAQKMYELGYSRRDSLKYFYASALSREVSAICISLNECFHKHLI